MRKISSTCDHKAIEYNERDKQADINWKTSCHRFISRFPVDATAHRLHNICDGCEKWENYADIMPNTARNRDKYMATGVEEPQNNAIFMEIDSITWHVVLLAVT